MNIEMPIDGTRSCSKLFCLFVQEYKREQERNNTADKAVVWECIERVSNC